MTIDEILEVVYHLNIYEPCKHAADAERNIMRLVTEIEAREREACAVIANQQNTKCGDEVADAIRARGEK